MSSYHSSFTYLNKNSQENFNWIISHFEADSGESETGLSTESIYTASTDGSRRTLYGTKYNGAEPVRITVIKQDGSDFSITDNRNALKWLTGAKADSWLDLYIGNEVKYRMLGHVQNVLQYKLDARVVGLIIVFESASPWAFSNLITETINIPNDLTTIESSAAGKKYYIINNETDDLFGYTQVETIYQNVNSTSLTMTYRAIKDAADNYEKTEITNLKANEIITLSANQMITSDGRSSFGTDFNFVFPKLAPGRNVIRFDADGSGTVVFKYYYCIKIGDMATDINAVSDPICNDFGEIQIDMLDWNRISNTPTTLGGYGIIDAYPISAVYNKNEVDKKMESITNQIDSTTSLVSILASDLEDNYYNKNYIDDNHYNKTEIDEIISNLDYDPSTSTDTSVTWGQILDKPTTLSGYRIKTEVQDMIDDMRDGMLTNDVYTKSQVDALISSADIDIDEKELNDILASILI